MKNLSLKICMVIAALLASVGGVFANKSEVCSASENFHKCIQTVNLNIGTEVAKEYSLLIEEDGSSFMFIIHLDDGSQIGKISIFGGYEWFKKTFNDLDDPRIYVQPLHLKTSGNYLSYTQSEYEILDISFEFTEDRNGDQFLDFTSKNAVSDVNSFISRNETFTFAGDW